MAQTINVDSKPALFMPTLYYSQGDVGRTFEIVVSSSDGFTIPSGATCQMVATKPSGLGFTVAGTVSGNRVTFTSTAVMTDEWGRFPAELRITSGNTVIGTANFYMEGERNPHPDGTTDGSQETLIPQLTLLVERAENAAQTATDDAIEAASATIDEVLNYLPTEVTNLKSDIDKYNSYNVLRSVSWPNHNWHGVTFTWDGTKYTASGTATSNSNYNLYSDTSAFAGDIKAGDAVKFHIDSTLVNVSILAFVYLNGAWVNQTTIVDGSVYHIPSDATGMMYRFYVQSGNTVSGTCRIEATVVPSNSDLVGKIELDDIIQGDSNSVGAFVANTKRLRVRNMIAVQKGEVLTFEAGTNVTQIIVNQYGTNMQWRENTGWKSPRWTYKIDFDGFINPIFGNADLSEITPNQYDATTILYSVNGARILTIGELENAIPLGRFTYKPSDVYSGTLRETNATAEDDTAFAIPQKIKLLAGESIRIDAKLPNNNVHAVLRVVGYTNEGMDGTLGTILANLVANNYSYTQPNGYSYVLVGVYYRNADDSAYHNVLDQFDADEEILTITYTEKRTCCADNNVSVETDPDAEYCGLCTQTGNVGGVLTNTPTFSGASSARAIYKLPVNKGDVITFGVNENWIASAFEYQYIFTDLNNTIIAHNDQWFTSVNKDTKIRFVAPIDCLVYIAIRNNNTILSAVNPTKLPTEAIVISKESTPFVDNIMICDNKTVYADDGKPKKILPSLSTQFCIHRGWADAPNNTLQSFWNAKRNGYSLMECDVRYSSDGVLLLSHDETITGKVNGVDTTYTVASETFATLEQLVFPNAFYNCNVPSLDSVLSFGRSAKIKYLFHCKTPSAQMAIDMLSLVKKYHMIDDVIFNTNWNTAMADKLVELDPNVNLLFAIDAFTTQYDSYLSREGKTYLSASISALDNTLSTAEYFALAEKGFIMGVWSVDNTTLNKAVSVDPYFIELTDSAKSRYDWFKLASDAIMARFNVSF